MPSKLLKKSVTFWVIVTTIGQWLFAIYIGSYFGGRFFKEGLKGFKGTHLPEGYVEGDLLGNISVALHILIPLYIMIFGSLQLYPYIRNKYLGFHRWNGRFYISSSILVSLIGIYMTWFRSGVESQPGSIVVKIGTTIGGLLVFFFSIKVIQSVRKRDFLSHEKWALRLFLVISAVWFFRVISVAWIIVTGGKGVDLISHKGPFVTFIHYGQWLIPLLFLELYFWGRGHKNILVSRGLGIIITLLTILSIVGLIGLMKIFWIPRIL